MSKLANLLFTAELARRLGPDDVTVNATTPNGLTATGFAKNINPIAAGALTVIGWFARKPADGAAGIVRLATDPDLSGTDGWLLHRARALHPLVHTSDPAQAAELWRLSTELTGIDLDIDA